MSAATGLKLGQRPRSPCGQHLHTFHSTSLLLGRTGHREDDPVQNPWQSLQQAQDPTLPQKLWYVFGTKLSTEVCENGARISLSIEVSEGKFSLLTEDSDFKFNLG